jgi:recombinational DNA repair ATPase RecF
MVGVLPVACVRASHRGQVNLVLLAWKVSTAIFVTLHVRTHPALVMDDVMELITAANV